MNDDGTGVFVPCSCVKLVLVFRLPELLNIRTLNRSKRRHRNGNRSGYIQNGDKPKQHLQF